MAFENIRTLLVVLFNVFIFTGLALGQSKSEVDKKLAFDGENTEKTIPVNVKSGARSFDAVLAGEIEDGSLYVTMYDPEGNRVNGFSLISVDSESEYHVKVNDGNSVISIGDGDGDHRVIISNGEGSSEHVDISTAKNGSNVSISVSSDKGKEIKDKKKDKSKDKKEGKFKVKRKYSNINTDKDNRSKRVNVTTHDEKGAKGVFVESFDDPMPGTWKFVIKSESAIGELEVKVDIN